MKRNKIMALLVAMTVTVSTGTSAFAMSADKYKDVPKENERFEYVEDVVDLGIMDGKAEDERRCRKKRSCRVHLQDDERAYRNRQRYIR